MDAILFFAVLLYTKKECVDTVFIIKVLQSLGHQFYGTFKNTSPGIEDLGFPVPSQRGKSCTGKQNTSTTQWTGYKNNI